MNTWKPSITGREIVDIPASSHTHAHLRRNIGLHRMNSEICGRPRRRFYTLLIFTSFYLLIVVYRAVCVLGDTHWHTRARAPLGRTSLGEGSACRRDLSLTTCKTHKWLTSVTQAGCEPAIPRSERLQTHALDRAIYPSPITFLLWVKDELSLVAGVF